MKLKIVSMLFFAVIITIIIDGLTNNASTYTTGGPPGLTGSPGDGSSCTSCHSGPAASSQTGWIISNIPAGGYNAGNTYHLTATATSAGHVKFGFEISPQNLNGDLLGTLINSDVANTQLVGSLKYITHTSAGTTGTIGFHTWTFDWVAPASGTGAVTFYGAFNITNSSNSSSGDTVYLSTLQIPECNIASPAITANGSTTFCQGGSVTLTSSLETSYLWSTGETTQSIIATSAGNYSVTITNSGGCSASSAQTTIIINSNPATPSITPGGNTTFCQGGSVTLTSGSATSYLWSTGSTTQNIIASSAGNYSVTVTNSDGCSASSVPTTVTVNSNPLTPTITPNGNTTFCQGGSVTLTSGSANSYLWNTGSTMQSITTSSAGNYSVTVTNSNGCSASSVPTTVTVNSNPATPTITPNGNTTFCQGGSVTLMSSTATLYFWSTGATTQSIQATSAGNYSVTVTNSNGCTASSVPTTVTINSNPATPTITPNGNTTFCQGGSVTLMSSTATLYFWSTGATTQSITVTSAGNYSVTATNSSGCSKISIPATVNINALPATPIITPGSNTTFCQGGSVLLTSVSANSYLWNTGATTQSITASSAGNFSVSVSNSNGCTKTSALTTVTINPDPVPSIIGINSACLNATGVIYSITNSGNSFSWSISGGSIATGQGTNSITVDWGNVDSGSVNITETNGTTNCSGTATLYVNISTILNPVISASGPTTICQGDSVTLDASAGYSSYLWNNGDTTQTINVDSSGSYSVEVTSVNGCSGSSLNPMTVIVNANPAPPTIDAHGNSTFCNGDSAILSSSKANRYLWSNGMTSQDITVLNPGTYFVTIRDSNSCFNSDSINIVVNTVDTSLTLNGFTLMANASSALYHWINCDLLDTITGAVNQSFSPTQNGSYAVIVEQDGCTDTSQCYQILGLGLSEIISTNNFFIYPNPANERLKIKYENLTDYSFEIILTNIFGQQLKKESVKVLNNPVEIEWNIKDLANGIYFLTIKSNYIHKSYRVEKN